MDGVRALATLLIIIYHLLGVSGQTVNNSNGIGQFSGRLNVAVSIFFVLSGYLLFKPYVEAMLQKASFPRAHTFYFKRIVRIMPAYWCALVLISKFNSVNFPVLSELLRNVLLLPPMAGQNIFPIIGQTWTLSIELSFYLSLPWIAALIRHRVKNMAPEKALRNILCCLLALYVSAFVFRVLFHKTHIEFFFFFTLWFPAHIDTFALGMCIAAVIAALEVSPDLKARRAQLVRMAPIFLLLSGATWYWSTQLGLALAFETTPFRIELFGHFLYGITSVAFVLPFCLDEGTSRIVKIFGSKAFVWLGTISYGMYLWHFLFLGGDFANTYLPYRIGDMGIATRLLITIPGSIAVATVSYYLIERPLIRSLSRVLQQQKIRVN